MSTIHGAVPEELRATGPLPARIGGRLVGVGLDEEVGRFDRVHTTTLRQEVARVLRDAILFGKVESGQRLIETDLAQELGVGRGAIREAIGQLEQQGLVNVVPNKGASVIHPTGEWRCEAAVLRASLEALAARMAIARGDSDSLEAMADSVRRMAALPVGEGVDHAKTWRELRSLDLDFHRHLVDAAGSWFLSQVWSTVAPLVWAIVTLWQAEYGRSLPPSLQPASVALERRIQQSVEIHQEVLDALRSGSMDHAEKAVWGHLQATFVPAANLLDPGVVMAMRWPFSIGDGLEEETRGTAPDSQTSPSGGPVR